jgi:hypothetical protein
MRRYHFRFTRFMATTGATSAVSTPCFTSDFTGSGAVACMPATLAELGANVLNALRMGTHTALSSGFR